MNKETSITYPLLPPPPAKGQLPSEKYVEGQFPRSLSPRMFLCITILLVMNPFSVVGGVGGFTALAFWLLSLVFVLLPSTLVTAKLARMFPSQAGPYVWAYRAFGSFYETFFGFFCNWWPPLIFLSIAGSSVVPLLQNIGANFGLTWFDNPVESVLAFGGVVALIWWSGRFPLARLASWFSLAVVGVGAVAALLVLGSFAWLVGGHPLLADFTPTPPFTPLAFPFGAATVGSCLGVQLVMNVGAEAEQPGIRPEVRSLKWAFILICLLYLAYWWALSVVYGQGQIAPDVASLGSFGDVFVLLVGGGMGHFIGASISLFFILYVILSSATYNQVLSRMVVMAAHDRKLPHQLRHPLRRANLFQISLISLFLLIEIGVVGSSSDPNAFPILLNLVFASVMILWTVGTIALLLAGVVLISRYPEYAEQVGGPKIVWVYLLVSFSVVVLVAAVVFAFLFPWTPLLDEGTWLFFLTLVVLGSAALGLIFALLAPDPEFVRLLAQRAWVKRQTSTSTVR